MMMTPQQLQEVRSVSLFSKLSDEQLDCIKAGEIIEAPAGKVLAAEGERNCLFQILLEGEIRISRVYDRQTVLMAVVKPGDYIGEVMLLLDIPWLSTVRVSKSARLFQLTEDNFWGMLTNCRSVAREIFRSASNRVRNFEGWSHQREKLVSLGTMAAGLAHELNNPASAARSAAAHLLETTDRVQSFTCQLGKVLEGQDWENLFEASQGVCHRPAPVLDHLARSDQAEAVAKWLEGHDLPAAWELAPTFVNAGVDSDWLAQLTEKLPPASHAFALGWLEARLSLKSLIGEVEQSTGRIAELVKAVKAYSYMDRSPLQEIDIHEGIESTLTMLGHKLKNVTVVRAFDRSLPRIPAYGSELNQVWTNLIDNAIHAVNGTGARGDSRPTGSGKICVGTSKEDNQVVVEIVDNGVGIPPEVQPRLFEPFFTTKSVGTGTGLGLVISNRIIANRHGGEIEFESEPGRTRFVVRLPLHQEQPTADPQTGK